MKQKLLDFPGCSALLLSTVQRWTALWVCASFQGSWWMCLHDQCGTQSLCWPCCQCNSSPWRHTPGRVSDGRDCVTCLLSGLHYDFQGPEAILPLWVLLSIKKVLKSIFLLCWYKDDYNMGWFIFIFFLIFTEVKNFPLSPKNIGALGTMPDVVREEFSQTHFRGHSGKRQGSWLAFPIESHEGLLPWHGYTEKIKSGAFHCTSFRVPQWLEPKIQV